MRCKACDSLLEDRDRGDLCHPCNVEALKARFPDQKVQDSEVHDLVNQLDEIRRITKQHENFSSVN